MDLISIGVAVVFFVDPLLPDRRTGPHVSFAEGSLLVVSVLLFVYLLYALLRGERL